MMAQPVIDLGKLATVALIAVLLILGGAAGGAWVGWNLAKSDATVAEVVTAKPAETLPDGGIVAARAPVPVGKPKPRPKIAIPKGAVEERQVSATIQPTDPDCDPLDLELSLYRDTEGGRRVALYSPDGTILDAVDVPVDAGTVPAGPRLWAAGVTLDLDRKLEGIWLDRDFRRVRTGIEVRGLDGAAEVWVKLGMNF